MIRLDELPEALHEIYQLTGYQFNDYSTSTVIRRLERRLINDKLTDLEQLIERMKRSREYAETIRRDFLITVTEMFRDPHVFRLFRSQVVPRLRQEPVLRFWVAGCASGEEAYSLALLLEEEGLSERSRIYATDIHEPALHQARSGRIRLHRFKQYSKNYLFAGGREHLNRYFTVSDQDARIDDRLLKLILFTHHNLAEDRSFNEFHAIFCRNVLIYFNRRLQDRVHGLFYQSLAPNGYLILGDKESIRLTSLSRSYKGIDPGQRVYQRVK